MGLTELSDTLWQERELLELLAFKLEEESLLRGAGRSRWLPRAAREVDLLVDALHTTELLRAVQTVAIADHLGLPTDATLSELAAAAPEPWAMILDDHRRGLLAASDEVDLATCAERALVVV